MTPSTLVFAIILTVAIFLTVRLWIRSHYEAKSKNSSDQIVDEDRAMQALIFKAEKMEHRIHALENILDNDIPDWRKKR